MSNILLILMGLFFIIPSAIYKEWWMVMTFVLFGLVFTLEEYVAHYYTGMTVSQHIWDLILRHPHKGYTIIGFMLLGWICLLLHLGMRFKR